MVQKIASEDGLHAEGDEHHDVVHEFFQQSNETDWDFVWRLALMHDYEIVVSDTTLRVPPGQPGRRSDGDAALAGQHDLVPAADVAASSRSPTVNVRALGPEEQGGRHGLGVGRPDVVQARRAAQQGGQRPRRRHDDGHRPRRRQQRRGERDRQEHAQPHRGLVLRGRRRRVRRPEDQGRHARSRSRASARSSAASSSSRRRRTATAARSATRPRFQISGRSSRTLLELIRQPEERDWSATLVVGVVTNNNDPEQMGRVRVKYPSLSDTEESAWARIATPSAGNARGLLMLPQANEEVDRRLRARRRTPPDRRRLAVQRHGQARRRPPAEPRRIVRDALEREDRTCTRRRTSRSSPTRT